VPIEKEEESTKRWKERSAKSGYSEEGGKAPNEDALSKTLRSTLTTISKINP
jgi:hypothetical protein